jgi:hypothetical protein
VLQRPIETALLYGQVSFFDSNLGRHQGSFPAASFVPTKSWMTVTISFLRLVFSLEQSVLSKTIEPRRMD